MYISPYNNCINRNNDNYTLTYNFIATSSAFHASSRNYLRQRVCDNFQLRLPIIPLQENPIEKRYPSPRLQKPKESP